MLWMMSYLCPTHIERSDVHKNLHVSITTIIPSLRNYAHQIIVAPLQIHTHKQNYNTFYFYHLFLVNNINNDTELPFIGTICNNGYSTNFNKPCKNLKI